MPTPDKIQWVSYPVLDNVITTTHVRLPNATAAGDTIIITGQFGSSSDVISAIADDQSGTLAGGQWVKDKIQADGAHGQSVCILRRSNCPASTRVVTITFSGATGFSNFQGILFNNLATASVVDGTPSGGNPTGTSMAAGNITTGTTDTLVVLVAVETSGSALTDPTHFTAPANYVLWAPNGFDETCCMYGTQAAAGTFNPTLTVGHSWTSSAVAACAYKTATSGGAPSTQTAEVRQLHILNFNPTRTNGSATTFTVDLPCPVAINTVAFAYDDGTNIFTSSPATNTSSSPANAWDATSFTQAPSGPACGFVYADGGTFSTTGTLTLTVSSAPTLTQHPFAIYIWCIASCGNFDQVQTGTGTLLSTPPVTQTNVLGTALTPSENNEVILLFNQEDSQTPTNITSSTGTFSFMVPDGGVYESLKAVHDAGFGHIFASTPAAYNFDISWSEYEGNGDPVGPWCVQAIAFKSQPFTAKISMRTN